MLNGLRGDIGESLCKNGRRGTRVQEKEKQAMVESGNLGSDRPKESHQTEVNQCKISETKAEMAR